MLFRAISTTAAPAATVMLLREYNAKGPLTSEMIGPFFANWWWGKPVKPTLPVINRDHLASLPLYKPLYFGYNNICDAEVAELADALCSGRSGSTLVWVRIPPSAP